MGQLTLGLRSLFIRAGLFFVMAALLAWTLGGTLWPRDELVDFEPVVVHQGRDWFWRLVVTGREPRQGSWRLMSRGDGGAPEPVDGRAWHDVAGPLVVGGALYYAGRTSAVVAAPWTIVRRGGAGVEDLAAMPDRLAVEQQLARLEAGLPLHDEETVLRQRALLLGEP